MMRKWLNLDSEEWAGILRSGFGASLIDVAEGAETSRVTIFRAGPFRIAYPEFPVGATQYPRSLTNAIVRAARDHCVDMLRFHSCGSVQAESHVTALDLGTHVIPDVQAWDVSGIEKARRSRNRANRTPLAIERAVAHDAPEMYALYLQTLSRRGGSKRYTLPYFRALAGANSSLIARLDGRVCGFVSFAYQGLRACYLHGAHDASTRRYYASDLLFYEMISMAKAHGAKVFDFLPSPPDQPSLAHYKSAWGAVAGPFVVSDIDVRPLRAGFFRAAKRMAALLASAR